MIGVRESRLSDVAFDDRRLGQDRASDLVELPAIAEPARRHGERWPRAADGRTGRQRLELGDATAGGVERDPAVAREEDLDPGVGVAVADDLVAVCVALAGQEALDEARRDALHPHQHRHRRRVVLAVAGLELGEALGDAAVAAVDVGDVGAVRELRRPQVRGGRPREVVGRRIVGRA